jgi:hypothetical protein
VLLGLDILHQLNFQLNNGYCLLSLPDSGTHAVNEKFSVVSGRFSKKAVSEAVMVCG